MVEVQRLRIVGQRRDQDIVGLGDGAGDRHGRCGRRPAIRRRSVRPWHRSKARGGVADSCPLVDQPRFRSAPSVRTCRCARPRRRRSAGARRHCAMWLEHLRRRCRPPEAPRHARFADRSSCASTSARIFELLDEAPACRGRTDRVSRRSDGASAERGASCGHHAPLDRVERSAPGANGWSLIRARSTLPTGRPPLRNGVSLRTDMEQELGGGLDDRSASSR